MFAIRSLVAVVLLALPFVLKADVVVEGDVDIRIKVINTSKFPAYKFYIEYQDYYYDQGYQPGSVSEVAIVEGEEMETGERGASSKIYAKDQSGNVYSTADEVGGNMHIDDFKASYVLQEIQITDVKDGQILYSIVKKSKVYPDGSTKRIRKGMVLTGLYIGGIDIGVLLLPIVCLGGLVLFFWMRRNPVREKVA